MTAFQVVLSESSGVTILTPWVSNLSFRSIDPGGFGSVTFDLSRQIDAREFEDQADLLVFDGETGEQVGGGRLVNPGRDVSRSGESWNMSALGEGPAHMGERKEPYILVDTRTDPWTHSNSDADELSWGSGSTPNPTGPGGGAGLTGLLFRVEESFVVTPGTAADITYSDLEEFPDARLGGYNFIHTSGQSTTNWRIRASSDNFATTDQDDPWVTGFTDVAEDVASVATPRTRVTIRAERIGTNYTGTTNTWNFVYFPFIWAMRRDRNGDWIDTGTEYLGPLGPTTPEIVTDCWARFCPRFDLANAQIDDSSITHHENLVWPNGVTPAEVLNQLRDADPGFTWAVWEKQGNGKWRTEWRAYDTQPRYLLSTADGFSETSTSSKYVKVFMTRDGSDEPYSVVSAERVDATLSARGIAPSNTVPNDFGNDAVRMEALLDDSELVAGTAQVTVARKVYDRVTGRWVQPWQILPGFLCQVAGSPRHDDWLNEHQVTGAAVFKIASNDYSTSSASSRLELNAYTVDERRAVANTLAAQR